MSLRDILVTLIIVGALPFILRHAYVGILLWTWISVMNPHKLTWGFATEAQFAAIAAVATFVGMFTTRDRVRMPVNSVLVVFGVFTVWICVTTVFAFHQPESIEQLEKVLKIFLMTFVAIAVLQERKHLQAFIWVLVLSLGFYGVKGGIFTIMGGGAQRVWGPPGGFISGNNEIGLALVMAIPLMYYLFVTTSHRLVKLALFGMMLLSMAAVLGTYSRGAFLAVTSMVMFLWWRAGNKATFGVSLVVAGILLVVFMPEQWALRMWTIESYETDGSATGRINAWWTMYNMANARLTGGGFASYTPYVFGQFAPDPSVPRAAHSIYFQVLGEHGWIGLVLFVAIFGLLWRRAARLRKRVDLASGGAWIGQLASACQVSLVGYAVGGAFLSLAYFDLPYYLLAAVIAIERLHQVETSLKSESASHRELPLPVRSGA